MKPVSPYLFMLLFCILFLQSCYKVEVEANTLPQGYSVAQIIGAWKITGVSSDKLYDWDGNGTTEKDIYATWSDCLKDNLYQFNSNYSGTYKLTCTDSKTGSWRLDGTVTLAWKAGGSAEVYEKIISMTSDTMKTETQSTQSNGQTYIITKVWTLQ